MLNMALLNEYSRKLRHNENEAIIARWQVGRYLNEEYGQPGLDDDTRYFTRYPIPRDDMNTLKHVFEYSSTEIGHWRRFALHCTTIDIARALIDKHKSWTLVLACGLRDRTEDQARAIFAGKHIRRAELDSGKLIIAIPERFVQIGRQAGLSNSEIKVKAETMLLESVSVKA